MLARWIQGNLKIWDHLPLYLQWALRSSAAHMGRLKIKLLIAQCFGCTCAVCVHVWRDIGEAAMHGIYIQACMHAWSYIYIYKIKYIFLHWLFQGSSWWARVPVSRVTMISNCNGTIELSYLSVVFLLTAGLPPVVLLVCHRCNCSSISRASKSSKQVVPALNI